MKENESNYVRNTTVHFKQGLFYIITFLLGYHIKAYTDFELFQCPRGLVYACSKTRLTFTGVQCLELTLGLFTVFRRMALDLV
jgi:hypothetical protein